MTYTEDKLRKVKHIKPKQSASNRNANLLPILIMLVTVLAVAVPVVWLHSSDPVTRYNAHLQKAMRLYADNRRFGDRVDARKAASAHRELLTALNAGERAFGRDDARLEDPLAGLLVEATSEHQAREARQYGERLLKIQQAKYPSNDRRLVTTYENLAQAYRELGDTAEEEQALQQKTAIIADPLAKRDLASFYLRHRQYVKAEPLYRKVVAANLLQMAELRVAKRQEEYEQAITTTVEVLEEYQQLLQALDRPDEYRKIVKLHGDLLRKIKGVGKS